MPSLPARADDLPLPPLRTVPLRVRIEPELDAALERVEQKAQGGRASRRRSEVVRVLLREALEARGELAGV